MASVISDPAGSKRIQFFDTAGKRKTIRLGKLSLRNAERVRDFIHSLVAEQLGHEPDHKTVEWLASLDAESTLFKRLVKAGLAKPKAQPKTAGLALKPFLDAYIAKRSSNLDPGAVIKPGTVAKPRTIINLKRARDAMVEYFTAERDLRKIDEADADDFWLYLTRPKPQKDKPDAMPGAGLAVNTARRICGRAKQFLAVAVKKRLILENPFAKIQCQVKANKEREYFVSLKIAEKVLASCPDAEWRLIFALSRFGGLRCPSEHLALKWSDVHWNEGRFTVHSPKTEHHEDRESRVVPIFLELLPYLEEAYAAAEEGATHVITRYRDSNANLRTQLQRIIRKAGLTPWPKLFHNLRSTRETELAETFPIHVVCEWIGNSQAVAKKHYLQITDAHFEQATGAAEGKAAQKAAQSAPRKTTHDSAGHSSHLAGNSGNAVLCATVSDSEGLCMGSQIPPPGLEPGTAV